MRIMYERCAAIDVHKKTVVVTPRWTPKQGEVQKEVRTFGTTTPELLAMTDWLREWEVTDVAMEIHVMLNFMSC